ncbi:hypothetical protein CH063_15408 [Colletotrichum higginsianum]|uniref:Secreted protein n=1 Tax=Colletotrichum higginsianum (strain IMI 349063) TaxID=759273 RepID=H1W2P3_COLHI|nr:hypothetical protein CH063_15408 [Colletotrichum higginsianum]
MFSLFFSLALFAFWLRSSVVSVLFSLISERSLRRPIVIIPIFGFREEPSVLAHGSSHSVPGITLPPGDANTFFHHMLWCIQEYGEEISNTRAVPQRIGHHPTLGTGPKALVHLGRLQHKPTRDSTLTFRQSRSNVVPTHYDKEQMAGCHLGS